MGISNISELIIKHRSGSLWILPVCAVVLSGCVSMANEPATPAPATVGMRAAATGSSSGDRNIVRPAAVLLDMDAAGCRWVQSSATVNIGHRDTRYQARADAINLAREQALAAVEGVTVYLSDLSYQQHGSLQGRVALVDSLLRVTQSGRALKEVLLEEGAQEIAGCPGCRYGVTLKLCVVSRPPDADPGFRVKLELAQRKLREKENTRLSVTATRDAYIYIYSVGMDWRACRLYPSAGGAAPLVPAGTVLRIPTATDEAQGRMLSAQLPPGKDLSAETVRVIAACHPLPGWIVGEKAEGAAPSARASQDCTETDFLTLIRSLNSIGIDWVDDVRAYTVESSKPRGD